MRLISGQKVAEKCDGPGTAKPTRDKHPILSQAAKPFCIPLSFPSCCCGDMSNEVFKKSTARMSPSGPLPLHDPEHDIICTSRQKPKSRAPGRLADQVK